MALNRQPASSTPRNNPYPGNAPVSTAGSAAAAVQAGGGAAGGGPATAPRASGLGGHGGGEDGVEEEVDPEKQAMFQAQDFNTSPMLWVKVGDDEGVLCFTGVEVIVLRSLVLDSIVQCKRVDFRTSLHELMSHPEAQHVVFDFLVDTGGPAARMDDEREDAEAVAPVG